MENGTSTDKMPVSDTLEALLKQQLLFQKILTVMAGIIIALLIGGVIYIASFVTSMNKFIDNTNVVLAEASDKIQSIDVDQINSAVEKSNELMDSMDKAINKADGLLDSMESAAEKTNEMLEEVSSFKDSIERVQGQVDSMADVIDGVTEKVNGVGSIFKNLRSK